MSRSKLREKIFRLLFRVEFYSKEEFADQQELFLQDEEQEEMTEQESEFVTATCDAITEKLSEVDALITEYMKGWNLDRIGKVELTILRLAVYEIRFVEEIPVSVSINEAVELAKKYGQEESSAFVNGVLAKFAG